jgi:predicted dienelactone hydrolase
MKDRLFFIFSLCALVLFGGQLQSMSRASQETGLRIENIGVRTLKYKDDKRGRPLVVELWYPTSAEGPFEDSEASVWIHPKEVREGSFLEIPHKIPLIVMSPGNRGDRREASWLVGHLVRSGFAVATIDHYGNAWDSYHSLISVRFWERTRDVSFVLDQLLQEPLLRERIDENRIGFVGYSMGGMTGLGLAGARAQKVKDIVLRLMEKDKGLTQEGVEKIDFSESGGNFADPRVKAIFLICPAVFAYTPESLRQIKVPVGLIAAIHDEVLPYQEHSYQLIKQLIPYKLKIIRKKVSHFSFLNQMSEVGKKTFYKAFQNDPPSCKRTDVHKEVGPFVAHFFQETL